MSRWWEKSEPGGAAGGVLVFAVGFALALGGARYLPQHVAAELLSARCSPSRSASAIALRPRASGDRGVGGLGGRSLYGHELVEQRRQDGPRAALTSGPGPSPG